MVLLGAGGAAKAIAYSLAKEVGELVILNRGQEKVEELAKGLGKNFRGEKLSPSVLEKNLRDADVMVNATSVGMHPDEGRSLVPSRLLKPDLTVMDIVYNPVETKLAKDAKAAGARVVSGVEMLIHQGAASFKLWTGQEAPVEVMRKAALKKLDSDVSK